MPDEDDRHVLAAAVTSHADILCTNNVRDFPHEAMASTGIELPTADALLTRLVSIYPSRMRKVHRTAAANLRGATDLSTIAALRSARATFTAFLVETLLATR
ncbi:MAG: hypothetical protein KDB86_13755 [Actinobacteria bacterium]|nr:hypothetical protein [Actinomycetota bacterium]